MSRFIKKILPLLVLLAVLFAAVGPLPVNAQGEPPVGEDPAPLSENPPAEGEPAPETGEDPAEPPAPETPQALQPAPNRQVAGVVEELAESDTVLYDESGALLPLACQTTLGVLTSTDPSGILGEDVHGALAGSAFNYFRADADHLDGTCQYSAGAKTLVCYWDTPIQQAVNDAALGSTVMVEGVHSEQVIINRQVSLAGRPGATLMTPNTLPNRYYHGEGWGGGWDYPTIWVQNTQGVVIRGFTITGPTVWTVGAGNQIVGIAYTDAGGEVYNNVIRDLRNPAGSNFFGVGVIAYQASNLEIHHNEIVNTDNAIEIERSTNISIHDNLLDRSAYGAIDVGTSTNGSNTNLNISHNELTNTPRQFFGSSYKNSTIVQNYGSILASHDNDGDDWTGTDNCPDTYNPDQADADNDGIGDACDALPQDFEDDGVSGGDDNCGTVFNPDQSDVDGDGIGDACDAMPNDGDNDGMDDGGDNCPATANADQGDADGDGIGDACDAMPNDGDNDGTDDGGDNCPATANADQSDVDGDGIGDACDAMPNDGDNDGIGDARDNCRATPNANQNDADGDGIGDACDDPYSPQDEVILPLFRTTTGKIVPATGGGAIELDCQLPYMILRLANGDEAIFRGLCGYRATLDAQPVESIAMLEPLPEEGFASGMMVSVLKEEKPVDPLPDGGMVTVSFLIPQAWQGKQLTILYWDPALNGGKGDWMALPDQVTSQGVVMPEVLNPGDGGDARWVYSGVENTGSRVEATLNFSGVFTLVEK